jgi:hypothetical protein
MATLSTRDRISTAVGQQKRILVNQSGLIASKRLSDLIDVDVSAQVDGSLLIYDEERQKYLASTLLEKQDINGGHY